MLLCSDNTQKGLKISKFLLDYEKGQQTWKNCRKHIE